MKPATHRPSMLRSFFLALSTIPPVIMLLLILGIALCTTMFVMAGLEPVSGPANWTGSFGYFTHHHPRMFRYGLYAMAGLNVLALFCKALLFRHGHLRRQAELPAPLKLNTYLNKPVRTNCERL